MKPFTFIKATRLTCVVALAIGCFSATSSVRGAPAWAWTESTSGVGVGFQHTWGFTDNAGATWSTFTVQPQLMATVASTVILSDNLSEVSGGVEPVSETRWVTTSFGTGRISSILDAATLRLSGGGTVELDLYSNDSGHPGTLLGVLTPSAVSIPSAESSVSFGGNGLQLAADTTYWEVLKVPSTSSAPDTAATSTLLLVSLAALVMAARRFRTAAC